jgi:putative glycosyltransferase (TIGR04348 family)
MRIQLVTPARRGSLHGNRITALRWARIFKSLGHRVRLAQGYSGEPCDLLVALHARRSAKAVFQFHKHHPHKPMIVALTGTDIYRDLRRSLRAQRVLQLAHRLIVLQPLALTALPRRLRGKAWVIYQSAEKTEPQPPRRSTGFFEVSVVGHLRRVKDPFRAALASRRLPATSRVRILQAGRAMEEGMARRARAEERRNPRYRWLGEILATRARQLIASSRVLVLSSRLEGGANVISEAVVDHVPVLATRIPGSVGLLGRGYPGYFPVRDTQTLARLLHRVETDRPFYARLRSWCARRAALLRPTGERSRWRELLHRLERLP